MAEVSLVIVGIATLIALIATFGAVKRATAAVAPTDLASRGGDVERDFDALKEVEEEVEKVQNLAERRPVAVSVPLLGAIAAGFPTLAEEQVEATIDLPRELVGYGEGLFMLRVHGESMREAAILDGDYVVVRSQAEPVNGEVVVALIEDEATVKTFWRSNGEALLKPANPSYEPISISEARILGKVVTVIRAM